ncbi:putative glycosyl transferase [Marinibacterium anthonyi]|nr:putative glycosyl transferase [Marinibacterium anthonyi]
MTDWTPLDDELDRMEMPFPVWWRDDDALTDTTALNRLIRLSERNGWPLHLAIVPAHADAALADRLRDAATVIPVTHGWAHVSHAPKTEKNAEFGAHRAADVMAAEAGQGHARLEDLLGEAPAPMFVPPWNRIAPDLLPLLPGQGFDMISTYNPRKTPRAVPGLTRVNTHLDPIDWHGGRSLVDPQALVNKLARDLADRREGRADATEPYGLLTHHLVHDDAIWDFVETFFTHLCNAPLYFWSARDPQTEPNS